MQNILKKTSILDLFESNNGRSEQKRQRTDKYSDVNDAVWDWHVMCRNSNILVSGIMLQEEALLVAEKLGIDGFTASNGWLAVFKRQHNICNMSVTGEEGDVRPEIVESWSERAREITRGWKAEAVWNMDETGSFWRGLPEKSLSERGQRCRGGKKAKQRNTWTFFVNAAGKKEDPIVIGKSEKPRYFKNLKDIKRPYKCPYFSNNKAWMNTDIMTEIFSKLNRHLKRNDRHILLFMDNAPCHPENLKGRFSNINIAFLPKNTTSKTQPLDAGIISNWKVKYKKQLLRYVCGQIDGSKSASDIVKSVNVLMAIEWGRQAWDELSPDTIQKCFKKTGLFPEDSVPEDDPFEGEESQELQELMNMIDAPCNADEYISAEDDIEVCAGYIDTSDPNWREIVRQELLSDDTEMPPPPDAVAVESDDEYDGDLKEPDVKSLREAIEHAQKLHTFAQCHGHEQMALSTSKLTDLLADLQISTQRRQTNMMDYFTPT